MEYNLDETDFTKRVTSHSVESPVDELSYEDLKRIKEGSIVQMKHLFPNEEHSWRADTVQNIQTIEKHPHIFVFNTKSTRSWYRRVFREADGKINANIKITWYRTYWYDSNRHLIRVQTWGRNAPPPIYTSDDLPQYYNDDMAKMKIVLTKLIPEEYEVLNLLATIPTKDDSNLSILCPQLNQLVCNYIY